MAENIVIEDTDNVVTVGTKVKNPRSKRGQAIQEVEEEAEEAIAGGDDDAIVRAAQALIRASRVKKSKTAAKDAVAALKEAISELDSDDFKSIMAAPEFQDIFERVSRVAGDKPGDPIYDDKGRQIGYVPYSYEDFCKIYPMYTWVSPRTDMSISINGVACGALMEGVEYTHPKIFHDIQQEAIRAEREAIQGQRATLQNSPAFAADGIEHGVGWYKPTNEELIRDYGVERN